MSVRLLTRAVQCCQRLAPNRGRGTRAGAPWEVAAPALSGPAVCAVFPSRLVDRGTTCHRADDRNVLDFFFVDGVRIFR